MPYNCVLGHPACQVCDAAFDELRGQRDSLLAQLGEIVAEHGPLLPNEVLRRAAELILSLSLADP